jgi:hypothetical protein
MRYARLVGHRVAAGVAQELGDEQQRDQPSHQEADRVEEAVVPGQGDTAEMPRSEAADMWSPPMARPFWKPEKLRPPAW